MLEQKIEALTAAIIGLTAALTSAQGATPAPAATDSAPTAEAPRRGRPPKTDSKPAAPARTKAEMQAALNEVKEQIDTATAKGLIKAAGFDKLADVTEDKFAELYDAAKAKLAELEGGEGGDDDM